MNFKLPKRPYSAGIVLLVVLAFPPATGAIAPEAADFLSHLSRMVPGEPNYALSRTVAERWKEAVRTGDFAAILDYALPEYVPGVSAGLLDPSSEIHKNLVRPESPLVGLLRSPGVRFVLLRYRPDSGVAFYACFYRPDAVSVDSDDDAVRLAAFGNPSVAYCQRFWYGEDERQWFTNYEYEGYVIGEPYETPEGY